MIYKAHALTLAVTAALIAGMAAPSIAQTAREKRMKAPSVSGAYAQQYPDQPEGRLVIGTDGFRIPNYVLNAPNQCWTDEGYGRFSNCEAPGS